MSTVSGIVRRRIDTTPTTLTVAVGDVVAVGVFVVAGELSHGVNPFVQAGRTVDTAGPFLLGWWLLALVGGLYTTDAWRSPKRAVAWTLPAWVGADVLAQALRATTLFHGNAAVPFFLVAAAVGGTLLAGWRVAVSLHAGTPTGG